MMIIQVGLRDGTSLTTAVQGGGTPLLFVHGSVADMNTFTQQAVRFSNRYQCIAYSRRFHPPNATPGPGDLYDTAVQAEDMLEVIHATTTEPVVMIGSSFGAYIGLIAAALDPSCFRALVLCEPPMVPLLLSHPSAKGLHDWFVREVIARSREAFLAGRDDEALRIFVDGVRGKEGWYNGLLPAIRTDLLRFAAEMKLEFLTPGDRYMPDVSNSTLHSLSLPSVLISGRSTTAMFLAILDVLEQNMPDVRRVSIPRAGHLSHLQNPDEWHSAVGNFLTSLEK